MILRIENPEDSTKKSVRTNKWIQESHRIRNQCTEIMLFLYTNNELSEWEIKKISFIMASNRIKYLEINLTKEVKELYPENDKITNERKQRRHK